MVRSKENRCMFFDSFNNLPAICVIFLSILMCILTNGIIELIGCLENNSVPNFNNKKDILKLIKEVSIQCILDIFKDRCLNIQPDMSEYIYKNFKPGAHYTSYCFKIVNTHYYLESILYKFQSKD